MATAIRGLKPKNVWKYFEQVSEIPRGSKNEAAIARFILEKARALKLESAMDETGNVVVRKPPSNDRNSVRSIALQCHLDMVCEKNKDSDHDFSK
ncbi:MAG: hypothetical protein P8Z37_14820, partial [Acidobacteriota bacterium]